MRRKQVCDLPPEMHHEHQRMVARLVKPAKEIQRTLTEEDCAAIHMVMGMSGEAGELLDAIKKWTMYRKPLDRDNVIEELGDLMFYMEGLMQELNITWSEVVSQNIFKLEKRYGVSYSDKAAQERADKL